MPSNDSSERDVARRRLLAAVGTAAATATAGCSGRLPGTSPETVDADATVESDTVVWQYPDLEGDREGIGYASVSVERRVEREWTTPALRLSFNSTVGGLAASEPHRGYEADWFRFAVWPARTYDGALGYQFRPEPPGQWEEFSAYYDYRASVKRSVVELRNVDTQGTIVVPAVFDPAGKPLPDRLTCSFAVQASRSGALGKTVRASGTETLALGGS